MYIWQPGATNTVEFVMVDSNGAEVAGLGDTFDIELRQPGGSFAAGTGTKAEISDGWYSYAAPSGECPASGNVAIRVTATGCVQQNLVAQAVPAVNVTLWSGQPAPDLTGLDGLDGSTLALEATAQGIKAKTDNLPASPAATGAAMTLTTDYDAAKTAASQASVNALPSAEAVASRVWDEPRSGHATAGTYGATSEWATGAGLTQQQVRDAMKLAPSAGAAEAGSVDAKLDAITSVTVGSGLYSHTITIEDQQGNPLDGVLVQVATDSLFTNIIRSGYTNNQGKVTLDFDAVGSYYGRAEISGYNISVFEVEVTA